VNIIPTVTTSCILSCPMDCRAINIRGGLANSTPSLRLRFGAIPHHLSSAEDASIRPVKSNKKGSIKNKDGKLFGSVVKNITKVANKHTELKNIAFFIINNSTLCIHRKILQILHPAVFFTLFTFSTAGNKSAQYNIT
jgi:hypothetical protein